MGTLRIYSFNNFPLDHTVNFKNYCSMQSTTQKRERKGRREREREEGKETGREGNKKKK